jgi:putative tricarboxylic transport membrane protein
MRRVGQLTGCAFFLLSVGLGYASSSLKYYTPLGPGPGFFPVWMCIFLGLLSLCVVVQSSRHSLVGLPNDFLPTRRGALRMFVVVVELFLLALLLPVLGFRLTMLAFM